MKLRHLISAFLIATLSGCISTGGGGSKPPNPPTPPAEEAVTIAVVLRDFVSPSVALGGARVTCVPEAVDNAPREGVTNADGFLNLDVVLGRQTNCAFDKPGYAPNTASILPGPGNTTLDASMTAITPPPPPNPVSINARVGLLRANGSSYEDDSGLVLPLYAHAGDLFSLYTRDPARALRELDDVARAGYQGIRVWSTLGCGPNTGAGCTHGAFWKGREVGPDITPDYWGKVLAFAGELRVRGLRAVWSQGDVGQLRDRRAYMTRLAAADLEQPFIDFLDCGNEAWQTGEPDPRKLAECVNYYREAGGRAILSLSSPPGEGKDEIDAFSLPPANVYDVHTFRDNHHWDKRRHIFSIAYESMPRLPLGINSEPPGNGRRVSASANKDELDNESVPLLAVAAVIARQAFVWFSGEGVIIEEGLHVEAGFWTTPRALALIPKNAMTYSTIHHSGDRWRGTRVLTPPTDENRVDCRTDRSGAFLCTLDGPAGDYRYQVERSFTGKLCNAETSECEDVSRNAGDVMRAAYRRGRFLVGQTR